MQEKIMKYTLVLITVLLLTGCAQKYVVPPSGALATLRVVTESKFNNIPVTTYAKDDCSDKPGRRAAFLNSKAIGVPYSSEATVKILANEKFIFSLYSLIDIDLLPSATLGVQYKWCTPVVEFIPKEGAEYVAYHKARENECSITIYEIDLKTGAKIKEPTAKTNDVCSSQVMEN